MGRMPTIDASCFRLQSVKTANLPAGTYTYFCRIHPFMRGSFRVK